MARIKGTLATKLPSPQLRTAEAPEQVHSQLSQTLLPTWGARDILEHLVNKGTHKSSSHSQVCCGCQQTTGAPGRGGQYPGAAWQFLCRDSKGIGHAEQTWEGWCRALSPEHPKPPGATSRMLRCDPGPGEPLSCFSASDPSLECGLCLMIPPTLSRFREMDSCFYLPRLVSSFINTVFNKAEKSRGVSLYSP